MIQGALVRNTMKLLFDYEEHLGFEKTLTVFDGVTRQPKEFYFHGVPSSSGGLTLVIPRSYPNVMLRKFFGESPSINYALNKNMVQMPDFPYLRNQPRGVQIEILKWLSEDKAQKVVDADTEVGKTYIALYRAAQLRTPTLIITHLRYLQDQWIERIKEHLTCDAEKICVVRGKYPNIDYSKKYQFYLMSHKTASLITESSKTALQEIIYNGRIGFKIVDECHRNLKSTFSIDTHSDVAYSLYLSATPERSVWQEKNVFGYVIPYKYHSFGKEVHTNDYFVVYVVEFNSGASDVEQAKMVTRRGLSLQEYGKYIKKLPEVKKLLLELMTFVENMNTGHDDKQHAILFSLIDQCDEFAHFLLENTGLKPEDIVLLHSKAPKDSKERLSSAKVIITTVESFGTGPDTDVDAVYNTVPFRNKVQQIMGRLRSRRSAIFIDFCDVGVPKCLASHRARLKDYKAKARYLEVLSYGRIRG